MGRSDLNERVLEWIARAEVLAGGKRLLDSFQEYGGETIPLQSPLNDALERVNVLSQHRRTVVLASGDPFFFGIGKRLTERFGRDRLLVFPNVTTVQALFARLAEPWEDVRVMSLHGREDRRWLRELRRHSKMALFTDHTHTPGWIAQQLLDAGIEDRDVVVGENLGLADESVRRFSLEDAIDRSFSPLNLVALLPQRTGGESQSGEHPASYGVREAPVLGLPEGAFLHQAGLITKMEVRAVVLAHLQLKPDLVLWDLGAGSGSVSIEAARMVPLRQVIAVEKHADRYRDLAENIKRFRCGEIRAVHGSAEKVLNELPDPDRVFIGGSGGELLHVLTQAAHRLRPGGRIVQTAVTMDTLEVSRSFWRDRPFEVSITQVQVNRSVPIGHSLRFEAINPVFVVVAQHRG